MVLRPDYSPYSNDSMAACSVLEGFGRLTLAEAR